MSGPQISVVVPLFQEAENVAPLVAELLPVLAAIDRPFEVLLVDDGSTDGTAARLAAVAARERDVRVITLRRHAGQSAALLAGFDAARGDVVVTLDGDLQNDPADIPALLAALGDADIACGVRRRRRDPWRRRVAGRVANAVRRWALHDGLHDVGCSLKAFPRRHVARLPRFDGVHRFLATLLVWQGCRAREVDVNHRPRQAGRSKYGVRDRGLRTFLDLLAMRWLRARTLDREDEP
jgi:dolichol-phosphate mannosyltransferase